MTALPLLLLGIWFGGTLVSSLFIGTIAAHSQPWTRKEKALGLLAVVAWPYYAIKPRLKGQGDRRKGQ